MTEKDAARNVCQRHRANVHSTEDAPIISDRTWTRAECRAIEIALGGGFAVLAVAEVIFRW